MRFSSFSSSYSHLPRCTLPSALTPPCNRYAGFDCSLRTCPTGDFPDNGGTFEVQSIACEATAGTFTLSFREYTTKAIPYNADAAAVKKAIEYLTSISNVTVALGGVQTTACSGSFTVTFNGEFGDVPELVVGTSALTRAYTTVSFTALQGGVGTTVETSDAGANSAIFTIHNTGSGSYTFDVTTAGTNYNSDATVGDNTADKIVILGTLLGGATPANDCTLTVTGAAGAAVLSAANVAATGTAIALTPIAVAVTTTTAGTKENFECAMLGKCGELSLSRFSSLVFFSFLVSRACFFCTCLLAYPNLSLSLSLARALSLCLCPPLSPTFPASLSRHADTGGGVCKCSAGQVSSNGDGLRGTRGDCAAADALAG